ncbi:hypothetical protein V8G54_002171 [Vigna mungo]|uniref:Uncharacterized protein n=1 Tax=Vigna mungo TaxID=3915 RepID=A0AAQ3SAK9_VIGMU
MCMDLVWCFFEILTGLRAHDRRRPTGQEDLVDWTIPCFSSKEKLKSIMDGRIKNQISPMAALESAQLIMKCLGHVPVLRPSMEQVLEGLDAIQHIHSKENESLQKVEDKWQAGSGPNGFSGGNFSPFFSFDHQTGFRLILPGDKLFQLHRSDFHLDHLEFEAIEVVMSRI